MNKTNLSMRVMGNSKPSLMGVLFIILFLSTFVYHEINLNNEKKGNLDKISSNIFENEDNNIINIKEEDNLDVSTNTISKTLIPGDGKTFAYFPNTEMILDPEDIEYASDGYNVFQWQPYDEVYDDTSYPFLDWRADSSCKDKYVYSDEYYAWDSNAPDYYYPWPLAADEWTLFRDIGNPWQPCRIFSPVFTQEYVISGRVYFLYFPNIPSSGDGAFSDTSITITFRLRLSLYNPSTNTTTDITSYQTTLDPHGMDPGLQSGYGNIPEPVIIPQGYRLKLSAEYKFSSIPIEGMILLRSTCYGVYDIHWDIDDGVYSNNYVFYEYENMLGVQLYMRDNTYPGIGMYGATNNTIYYQQKNISISTAGGVHSYYKWDGDPDYTEFEGTEYVLLPTDRTDWRYLEVKAVDEYNNTRINLYRFGYDASVINIVLNNPNNGSNIGDSSTLEFSAFNITYALCEWDKNGTQFNLTETSYTTIAPYTAGYHNLTVNTYDSFGLEIFFYWFTVDDSSPIIELYNVLDGSTQAPGKLIQVNITEETGFTYVKYRWDDKDNITWTPTSGTIYGTYLPESEGLHWLYIFTEDIFGHIKNEAYNFTTSSSELLVELKSMINNSYYYGGDDVEVTISGINDTIYFKWDGGVEKDGSSYMVGSVLVLNGSESLPEELGIHFLTIRTFEEGTEIEHTYIFKFTIDKEAPIIDNSFNDYNDSRFLDTDIFTIILSDNLTDTPDLTVYYSINNGTYQTLLDPFDLLISAFYISDGVYNLTLYVYDIANNSATAFIIFTIDTSNPVIEYTIENLVIVVIEGNKYVPANTTVTVEVDDADPNTTVTYSWGGSVYHSFVDNFTLNYPDGASILYINASDTLGHSAVIPIDLIIDSEAPNVSFPKNYTKINMNTKLHFYVEDISEYTVDIIRYRWDILEPGAWYDSYTNDFEIYLIGLYVNNEIANFSIYVEDVVGNNYTYEFSFNVDLEAPYVNLYNLDDMSLINISETYYSKGNSSIFLEIIDNSDLMSVEYDWASDDTYETLTDPWVIYTETVDQIYNLTIRLKDNTADGDYPNTRILVYTFVIDDIKIGYINPIDFSNDYYHQMEYGDSFLFTVNITDGFDGTEITNVTYSITKDEFINLNIVDTQLDNITYQFIVYATNVTDGGNTIVNIDFWQFSEYKESLVITLSINKKEGNIVILEEIDTSVIYGEIVSLVLKLNDNLNITSQLISRITINITEVEFIVNYIDLSVQIDIITSLFTNSKGNYSFEIYAESNFYYGIITGPSLINVEIKPIPVVLYISVSNYTIIEGTQLALSATLLYQNGTPIPLTTIKIYFYIVLKNDSKGVNAQVPIHDRLEILTGITNSTGQVTLAFEMVKDIYYIYIEGEFEGDQIRNSIKYSLEDFVFSIPPEGLPKAILYGIIAGSILLIIVIAFVIYKLTRRKPFEIILDEITENDVEQNLITMSPGVILSIFDQRKGPIPLISNHSLELPLYKQKIAGSTDNLILRICDQAYSSLGFEEHDDTRRTGSITLIKEQIIGFTHGIQLKNPATRGGYENLTLITLADSQYKHLLLSYQSYLYQEIDELDNALKDKKPAQEIKLILEKIRKTSVKIMLAAQQIEK